MRAHLLGAGAALITAGCVLAPAAADAHDPAADTLTQQVTRDGETVTMRLRKLALRGPHFQLRVQQPDGRFTTAAAPIGERSFLGTVDERPGAVASGIVTADGRLRGSIYFDRGATWFTLDGAVTGTRGLAAPTFKWPTKANLAPGLAGGVMRAWDLAIDTDSAFVAKRGSTASVLEAIEFSVNATRAIYMRDALLAPRLARIVVRPTAARDPYLNASPNALSKLKPEWTANQADAERDETAVILGDRGGGLAFLTNFNPDFTYAQVGADDDGAFDVVGRHELGHNFDIDDNHAGNPEGATVMEGNQYARFGGPELQSLLTSRNDRLAVLDTVGRFDAIGLPPYAGLDLADGVAPSSTTTIDVLANDHDANDQALRLVSVDPVTAAGGTAAIENGKVVYRAPAAATPLDSFAYVVADTCGQTATGVVLARTAGAATRAADAPAAAGRQAPLLDSGKANCGALGADSTTRVPLGAQAGPAISGALVRVRVTRARREGRVTVWPCGRKRPKLASLHVSRGASASNQALIRTAGAQSICVANGTRGRVRLDLRKLYRPGPGTQPVAPLRVLDTRRAGTTRRVRIAGRRGVRVSDRRLVLNVSATRPTRGGSVRVFACGTRAPQRATLRLKRGRSTSRLVFLRTSSKSRICVRAPAGVRMLVDLQGRDAR